MTKDHPIAWRMREIYELERRLAHERMISEVLALEVTRLTLELRQVRGGDSKVTCTCGKVTGFCPIHSQAGMVSAAQDAL